MPIILFDIDGTLIRAGGAGKRAMESALCEEFGVDAVRAAVEYSGRTDRAIAADLLAAHGREPSPANVAGLVAAYLGRLPAALRDRPGEVLPGVRELLAALAGRADVLVGLLTGNARAGARLKLGHYGLWGGFACGGFGDDVFDRDDVARAAVADAARHLGRAIDPAELWVIGDTPLDVSCARAVGATAVAVCTGWHTRAELADCRPDHLFDDLSDHAGLLAAWGG